MQHPKLSFWWAGVFFWNETLAELHADRQRQKLLAAVQERHLWQAVQLPEMLLWWVWLCGEENWLFVICICVCMCVYLRTLCVSVSVCLCVFVCIYLCFCLWERERERNVCVCVCVCACMHVYVCIWERVHVCVCMWERESGWVGVCEREGESLLVYAEILHMFCLNKAIITAVALNWFRTCCGNEWPWWHRQLQNVCA